MQNAIQVRVARALGLALALLAATPATAWSPLVQETIVRDSLRLAPPGLARQLHKHVGEMVAGAMEPEAAVEADAGASLEKALAREVALAVAAIRAHEPFAVIAKRLGRVSHFASALANPLVSSDDDREEPRYFTDFLTYVESARPRLAVVVYEWEPPVTQAAEVEGLARAALRRGRMHYPLLGAEYRRIEFGSGARLFDDRSTAFGLAALAYSHAVTDSARLYRYVWLASGGHDPRPVFGEPRDRVLVLDQGGVPAAAPAPVTVN